MDNHYVVAVIANEYEFKKNEEKKILQTNDDK